MQGGDVKYTRRVRRALALGAVLVGVVGLAIPASAPAGAATGATDTRPPGVPADQPARGLQYDGLRPARPGGPCGKGFEMSIEGHPWCTHGPDPAPLGVDVRTAQPALAEGPYATPAVAPECIGTGTDGPRVQVVYAWTTGSANRFATFESSIQSWAAGVDDIFIESAAETGGEQRVRWVTDPATCEVVVQSVEVPAAADDTFGATITYLRNAGFDDNDRKYLVFMDAALLCGIAIQYLDDSPEPDNNNNGGPVAAPTPGMIARVDTGCWGAETAAHELMHNLGAVQESAPNSTAYGHCTDEYDRMCYDDGVGTVLDLTACPAAHDQLFDCNHDDYYNTDPADGSYLDTHWNTARSKWLYEPSQDPDPGDTDPPGVSVIPPASLTAPLRASFDETVRPVTATNFTVSVLGSVTPVTGTTLTCESASELATNCTTGNVRSADLTRSRWTPGQRYQVALNPVGSSPIGDPTGNELEPVTTTFRASTSEQDNSAAAAYTWRRVASTAAYGGSYNSENAKGAKARFIFTNGSTTTVRWYTVAGPTSGKAKLTIDGQSWEVDLYSSSKIYKASRRSRTFPPGRTHSRWRPSALGSPGRAARSSRSTRSRSARPSTRRPR